MLKRIIKRISPDVQHLRRHAFLNALGDRLHHPNLWHLNRHSVANAVGIGLFCAFLPLPFQMLLAAALATLFRGNLAVAVAAVWVTNPVTMPALFYFCYKAGSWIMGLPPEPLEIEWSSTWLMEEMRYVWQPFLLGCVLTGAITGMVGSMLVRYVWTHQLLRQWRARRAARR